MYELDEKINALISWVVSTYGITSQEAIRSIKRKLEDKI